ncbi:MAG: class I SAM-dependent methyltransferase [Salinibacterium sp.]|nr:class I SAM-dependent methyltransferase [Salinibacterium sp.]
MTTNDTLKRDVLGWDVRTWSVAVDFWERALPAVPEKLTCLEIGAGPGGPSLWLALRGHAVVCSNLANTEAMASPLHEEYGVSSNIEYRDIDVTDIPFENHFDVVIFKSVLGGVGSLQKQAMQQVLKSLKPGGILLFAENIRGTIFHRLARAIAYRIRRTSWRYPTLAGMTSLLSDFSCSEIHTNGVLAMFGTSESQRLALAAVDDRVTNRIVPRTWKYMGYGSAIK